MYEIIIKIKTIIIEYILLGIIASFLMMNLAVELKFLNDSLLDSDAFFLNMAIIFLVIELVMYCWSLVNNKNISSFNYTNFSIFVLFILEVLLMYSIFLTGDLKFLGINYHDFFLILEIIKAVIILINSTIKTIEIFELKIINNNYKINHLEK